MLLNSLMSRRPHLIGVELDKEMCDNGLLLAEAREVSLTASKNLALQKTFSRLFHRVDPPVAWLIEMFGICRRSFLGRGTGARLFLLSVNMPLFRPSLCGVLPSPLSLLIPSPLVFFFVSLAIYSFPSPSPRPYCISLTPCRSNICRQEERARTRILFNCYSIWEK